MNEQDLDKKIDRALREAPDFELPVSFADTIMNRIEAKREAKRQWEIFWVTLAGVLLITAAGISIFLTGFKPSFQAFPFLNNYAGLIIFGIAFIGLLSWLEKRFLKKPSMI